PCADGAVVNEKNRVSDDESAPLTLPPESEVKSTSYRPLIFAGARVAAVGACLVGLGLGLRHPRPDGPPSAPSAPPPPARWAPELQADLDRAREGVQFLVREDERVRGELKRLKRAAEDRLYSRYERDHIIARVAQQEIDDEFRKRETQWRTL